MGFTPSLLKKTDDRTLFYFGSCCKRGRHIYTTTPPSFCIPASYCHLSATLQAMSIIVVNLEDNRAVFRIFIALLRFSFDSPSYVFVFVILHIESRFVSYFINICVFFFLSGWKKLPQHVQRSIL